MKMMSFEQTKAQRYEEHKASLKVCYRCYTNYWSRHYISLSAFMKRIVPNLLIAFEVLHNFVYALHINDVVVYKYNPCIIVIPLCGQCGTTKYLGVSMLPNIINGSLAINKIYPRLFT